MCLAASAKGWGFGLFHTVHGVFGGHSMYR